MKTSFQIIFLLFNLNCFAQDVWTNINESHGLTDNSVISLAFDNSNNVWIGMGSGTFGNGIDKFDGNSFVNFNTYNSQIPSNAIREMKIDQNDNLWIGFYGGSDTSVRKLTKFDGSNWTVYDTDNSNISSDNISSIKIDSENNVWTSSDEGFSKYDGLTFTNYQLDVFPGYFIVEDSSSIWCSYKLEMSGANQGLAHFNPITGEIDLFNQDNSNIPAYSIRAIEIDSNGIIILGLNYSLDLGNGTPHGGIALFNGIEFNAIMPFSSTHTGVYDLKIDIDNNLWVSTRCEGLYKYDWNTWVNVEGPPSSGCSYIIEQDLLGNMWFGEFNSGAWTNKEDLVINTTDLNLNNIQVYPNPANLFINVSHEGTVAAKFKLYSSIGVLIKHQNLSSSNSETQISIVNCNAGMYFWKIEQNGKILKSGKTVILNE